MPRPPTLRWVLSRLARHLGPPQRAVSVDPFHLILYQQVGYLVSEAKRRAAFDRLAMQTALASALPATPRQISVAAGLLRLHGETTCRRTAPACDACPLASRCAYPRAR